MDRSHVIAATQSAVALYRRAPVTFSLIASYLISNVVSTAWLDYRLFVSLPGGPLPKNIFGWAVHFFALSPLSLARSWTSGNLVRSYLPLMQQASLEDRSLTTGASLPRRNGARPTTAGTVPHRQIDQFRSSSSIEGDAEAASSAANDALERVLAALDQQAQEQPSHVRLGRSQIEPDSSALFAVSHTLVTQSEAVSRSTRSARFPSTLSRRFLSSLQGEFAHIHCTRSPNPDGRDSSLHVTLHPHDAALVVELGWGELHPLAGFPSYSGFWIGWPAWLARWRPKLPARWWSNSSVPQQGTATKAMGLPPTYCLVYAPRDNDEAQVVLHILDAAAHFAIGTPPPSRS
ncbi:uncharacterized protein PAN0_004c2226 [Moesziomyces antarcticus]|uniref:Uncharacterized protein n=2 Tax=Pseudozyma antarctica TaxID=84753 RepID=A0A5C3FN06_PSEA2|nr:uncharacterized protein PAN0_004c2226 [Moesziomyces antarcticus]GAK64017.1 conserved hypothetical protein [Moesziomyces antarcticus]SPO44769.1 uncharacterized protein PSANT_02455 [Moesziomyces antarcticus]